MERTSLAGGKNENRAKKNFLKDPKADRGPVDRGAPREEGKGEGEGSIPIKRGNHEGGKKTCSSWLGKSDITSTRPKEGNHQGKGIVEGATFVSGVSAALYF